MKGKATPTDTGKKFRFAEQSVTVSDIPKDAEGLGQTVCESAKALVALLKKASKRSEKMQQLLVTITSIGDNSRTLLEIDQKKVVELNIVLKNAEEKRTKLTGVLETLNKEIDDKCTKLGKTELETAMKEKDTKALNANTAATNAATAKVNSQTDEQNDFIKIYAAQIAETRGD